MSIPHIYGARAVLLLFCDHQDTESESCEIEIGVAGPIFTQKLSKPLWKRIPILHKTGVTPCSISSP